MGREVLLKSILGGHDIEKARPYYETLKQRNPGSDFIRSVSGFFEKKTLEPK
jgi:hypothetical protein